MKTNLLFHVVLLAGLFAACSKNDDNSQPLPQAPAGKSTAIFYVDTFRVYSTDLTGANRKLIVDENISSQNNYITSVSVMPGSGKIVYGYTTGFQDQPTIRIVNADGSNKKTIKTLPASTGIQFVKGVDGNRVFYGIASFSGTAQTFEFRSMNEDGSDDKKITVPFNLSAFIKEPAVSAAGKGFLLNTSATIGGATTYNSSFQAIENGAYSELKSKNILNEPFDNILSDVIISADATKVAYLQKTSTPGKIDIKVKDISQAGTTAITAYTYTIPASGPGAITNPDIDIYWVDGTEKLIITYGRQTFPKGSPSDYIFCQLVTISTGASVSWSFTGDGSGMILAN